MAYAPMKPMDAQIRKPQVKSNIKMGLFSWGSKFLFRSGMKIPCTFNPVFRVSHSVEKFHEKIGISLVFSRFLESQSAQQRNNTQLTILTMPQARRLTPKSNFSISITRTMRIKPLDAVMNNEPELRRLRHWSTIKLKYSRSEKRQLSHISPSQRRLNNLLLVCLNSAQGISSPSFRWSQHILQEQQLKSAVRRVDRKLGRMPADLKSIGRTRMMPPIIALRRATRVIEACVMQMFRIPEFTYSFFINFMQTLSELKNQYRLKVREGDFASSLQIVQNIVQLCSSTQQLQSEVDENINLLAQTLNAAAMVALENNDCNRCHTYLKKAQTLPITDRKIRSTTLNNLGCYFRKANKLTTALQYLRKSLEIDNELKDKKNIADAHLNICAVLSSLQIHDHAVYNALTSIIYIQAQIIQELANSNRENFEKLIKNQRMSVLALGLYNLGVEFEHLNQQAFSKQFYEMSINFTKEFNSTNKKLLTSLQSVKKKFEKGLAMSRADTQRKTKGGFSLKKECPQEPDFFYRRLQEIVGRKPPIHECEDKQFKITRKRSPWNLHRGSVDGSLFIKPRKLKGSNVSVNRRLLTQA